MKRNLDYRGPMRRWNNGAKVRSSRARLIPSVPPYPSSTHPPTHLPSTSSVLQLHRARLLFADRLIRRPFVRERRLSRPRPCPSYFPSPVIVVRRVLSCNNVSSSSFRGPPLSPVYSANPVILPHRQSTPRLFRPFHSLLLDPVVSMGV